MRWRSAGIPGIPERVLASTVCRDGVQLAATRSALYVVGSDELVNSLPWEAIAAADWDNEAELLRVSEVGEFGQPRPRKVFALDTSADSFLRVLRERVTASVVLTRAGLVSGRQFRVIGRRSPVAGEISWFVEYDAQLDPANPEVARAVADLLAAVRDDVGQ